MIFLTLSHMIVFCTIEVENVSRGVPCEWQCALILDCLHFSWWPALFRCLHSLPFLLKWSTSHVTWYLSSDWSSQCHVTISWPVIGQLAGYWSDPRDQIQGHFTKWWENCQTFQPNLHITFASTEKLNTIHELLNRHQTQTCIYF